MYVHDLHVWIKYFQIWRNEFEKGLCIDMTGDNCAKVVSPWMNVLHMKSVQTRAQLVRILREQYLVSQVKVN